jgi:hypothetical protein
MPYKILTSRLKEYFPNYVMWEEKVTLKDIEDGLSKGLKPIEEYYHNWGDSYENMNKTKEWHIRRVIYFIKNPEKIDPIIIDNEVLNRYILPYPIIVDGHHRVMAKFILGHKYIDAEYGGRKDVLDYLTGKTDIKPIE